MSVYFIQLGDNGPIKIGSARDARKRVASIQCAHPERIRLLAITDGGHPEEGELHRRFAEYRLRGEWFTPAKPLLDFIAALPPAPAHWRDARLKELMDSPAAALWFDPSIPTDFDVEKRTGIRRTTLQLWLGPSGRTARKWTSEEAKLTGKLGGRPPKKRPMTKKESLAIWKRQDMTGAEKAAEIGLSVRQIYRWLGETGKPRGSQMSRTK